MGISIHKGISVGVQQGSNPNPIPAILKDGNTVAWYDAQDSSTITKDVSNFVSRWNDKLGSGHDLIQATATKQPLINSEGVLFDGVNDFMKTSSFTFSQPEYIYIVVKQVTNVSSGRIFDGVNSNSVLFWQSGGTSGQAYAGSFVNIPILNTGVFKIFRFFYNGANSTFRTGRSAAINGNSGANNSGGFTLGGKPDGSSNFANIVIKEMIARTSANGEDVIYNYLEKKHNLLDLNYINKNVLISGDSLIGNHTPEGTVAQHMTIGGLLSDISTAGDTIDAQIIKYNALSTQVKANINIAFILVGINNYWIPDTAAQAITKYQNFITSIKANAPNAKIIITKLLPCDYNTGAGGHNQWIFAQGINSLLSTLTGVDAISTQPSDVMDDGTGKMKISYSCSHLDGLHENTAGRLLIATDWYNISKNY